MSDESGKREVSHAPLCCFPCIWLAKLQFGGNTSSATPSTYPTNLPSIFCFFLEGALGLADPLCAFSFSIGFFL